MLRHPNIIEYRESFLHEHAMMIVMEYAAGGSLDDLIQARANEGLYLDEEEEIAFLFAQIILPMHHIHSKKILHRDLKAQNIFLTRSKNFVKVRKIPTSNSVFPLSSDLFIFKYLHCRYSKAYKRHTKGKNFVIFISRICLLHLEEFAS